MTNTPQSASRAITPASRPEIARYLRNVRNWHGYIRFLGLPDRRDNPDIIIDRLFVEPQLAPRRIMPGEEPQQWLDDTETIFDALRDSRALLILGDPGSGKSTLVNYLVWTLAAPRGALWTEKVGDWQLPAPMVLRELDLRPVEGFSDLLQAFMAHPICEPLRSTDVLQEAVKGEGCIFLLDGVDELGDREARLRLRAALYDGIARYPACRWILTSRIVGYEEVPFDRRASTGEQENGARSRFKLQSIKDADTPCTPQVVSSSAMSHLARQRTGSSQHGDVGVSNDDLLDELIGADLKSSPTSTVQVRYVAPFDDHRIEAFARNWYTNREASSSRAEASVRNFMNAIQKDRAIIQLGRIPNLLTMMTLIHRNEATLPHGRVLLYDRISEAYLESIDRYRGVQSGAFSLAQKRQWLARIGFEMQKRRSVDPNGRADAGATNLLVKKEDVESWVDAEMASAPQNVAGMSSYEFLDIVGRRSGLFLPRGENKYAFVHLSFQDYFAALAMQQEVTGPSWARGKRSRLGLSRKSLSVLVQQASWFETFAFLFELLADRPDWHSELLDVVFDWMPEDSRSTGDSCPVLQRDGGMEKENAEEENDPLTLARLLVRLVTNPLSGLSSNARRQAIGAIVDAALRQKKPAKELIRDLLGLGEEWSAQVTRQLGKSLEAGGITVVNLSNVKMPSFDWLRAGSALTQLNLEGSGVDDIEPLRSSCELEFLDLSETDVNSVAPLEDSTRLRLLFLRNTKVEDISPLVSATRLRAFSASHTNVSDISVVRHWEVLEWLMLNHTQVVDIGPLAGVTTLRYLNLAETGVEDAGPLGRLSKLRSLYLRKTKVENLRAFQELLELEELDLGRCPVRDISPLASLGNLRVLDLKHTEVEDLAPVSQLRQLRELNLWGTSVADLEPLAGLKDLEKLDLDSTRVADLAPLGGMLALKELDLRNVEGAEQLTQQARQMLPNCQVLV